MDGRYLCVYLWKMQSISGNDRSLPPTFAVENILHWESLFKGQYKAKRSLLLLLLSHFSCVRLLRPRRWQPTRLRRPWDSPGKNTGVGCHFLLQCMKVKVKSLNRVRLLATLCTAAYQAPPSMGFSRQEYSASLYTITGSLWVYWFIR